MSFQKELEQLINRYNMENESHTPDFILAQYLMGCLDNLARVINTREGWYGRPLPEPDEPVQIDYIVERDI